MAGGNDKEPGKTKKSSSSSSSRFPFLLAVLGRTECRARGGNTKPTKTAVGLRVASLVVGQAASRRQGKRVAQRAVQNDPQPQWGFAA